MIKSRSIAILVSTDLSNDQRVQRITESLCKCHDVTLFGRNKSNSIPFSSDDYEVKRIYTIREKGPLFYLALNWGFFWKLIFSKTDIVVANDLDTLPAAWAKSILHGTKLVFDAHEYFEEVPELQGKPRKKAIWLWIARKMANRAHLRYTVGEALAIELEKKYGCSFQVVRNVPYLEIPQRSVEKQCDFSLIYQGALNKGRGCELMIQAMKFLPQCELWLVGDGDLAKELNELARKEEYSDRVKFFGKQSPEELKKLTPKAHVGLNLLDNSSLNYKYSLANKFFDYMHAGIPSINMNFHEYRSILKHSRVGLLLESLDIEEYVQAIEALRTNEELYLALANNSADVSRLYNWQNEEQKLLSMFQKL